MSGILIADGLTMMMLDPLLVRPPAAAGRFYPADPMDLSATLARLLTPEAAKPAETALALLVPHAGYAYSGAVAGRAWARVVVPRRVLLLCPNHTGYGGPKAIWSRGHWALPGGGIEFDAELTAALCAHTGLVDDREAHLFEHAIEVQLPFIRARQAQAKIAPICLGDLSLGECVELGHGIAQAIRECDAPVLVVASSDMSHSQPPGLVRELDRRALGRVLDLDPEGLFHTVQGLGGGLCGLVPLTVALAAAVARGATRAEIIDYAHSGEVSGERERVVGYAGAWIG